MTAAAPQTRAGFSETCLLASVGGSVDAIGVITLGGLFVSHMSGNTAAQGVFFGQGQWWLAWPHLVAVPIFLLGLFLGYLLMERAPTPRQCAGVLVLEAGLLFIFFILLLMGADYRVENPWTFLTAVPPLIAMGIQNATLRGLKLSAFPSTYVTGVLDTVGRTFAKAIAGKAEERAEKCPHGPACGAGLDLLRAGCDRGQRDLFWHREVGCPLPDHLAPGGGVVGRQEVKRT